MKVLKYSVNVQCVIGGGQVLTQDRKSKPQHRVQEWGSLFVKFSTSEAILFIVASIFPLYLALTLGWGGGFISHSNRRMPHCLCVYNHRFDDATCTTVVVVSCH